MLILAALLTGCASERIVRAPDCGPDLPPPPMAAIDALEAAAVTAPEVWLWADRLDRALARQAACRAG